MRPSALIQPLEIREFRLFWIATAVSLTGDQLTFIALPWLILKLTGDPLVMGMVVAVAAVPRALFMLLGGAVTDKYSPRIVMIVSNFLRMLLVALLAAITFFGVIEIWMIFVIGFAFGIADAFMFPASTALPPRLLESDQLAAGNSLVQGTAQLSLAIGPMIAAVLIAWLGVNKTGVADVDGLALVFALDSITFGVPILALLIIRERFPPVLAVTGKIWSSLIEGLRYTWNDVPIRTFALLLGVLTLVLRGPFVVGIPAFADAFLIDGVVGFGVIMAALGVGAIIGTLIAGTTHHPEPHRQGAILMVDFLVFGAILITMAFVHELWLIALMVLLGGIVDGYVIILLITWTQKRVPSEKLGRVMSVIMLFGQGLFPVSSAIAGVLAGWDLLFMFLIAGSTMVICTLLGLLIRPIRRMGYA